MPPYGAAFGRVHGGVLDVFVLLGHDAGEDFSFVQRKAWSREPRGRAVGCFDPNWRATSNESSQERQVRQMAITFGIILAKLHAKSIETALCMGQDA